MGDRISKTYDVACVGMLVADMFCSPMKRLPGPGELMVVDEITLHTGGCAANTGVDLVKLGASVRLMGKVGDDVLGRFVIDDMAEKGLDPSGIRVSMEFPTSRTVILPIISEDRRYVHTFGANTDFGYADIDLAAIKKARILYVGGYLVLPGFDQASLARLFMEAKAYGTVTVLDVIVPSGTRSNLPDLRDVRDVLPHTDAFLPNEDEARILTGEDDPSEQAEMFLDLGAKAVVITRGAHGSLLMTEELSLIVASYKVEVVDPSGGGDAFDAGFIVGMLRGLDERRTLELASAAGALACTKLGCTPGVLGLEETFKFIRENRLDIHAI